MAMICEISLPALISCTSTKAIQWHKLNRYFSSDSWDVSRNRAIEAAGRMLRLRVAGTFVCALPVLSKSEPELYPESCD
jgi:hypothetical protein